MGKTTKHYSSRPKARLCFPLNFDAYFLADVDTRIFAGNCSFHHAIALCVLTFSGWPPDNFDLSLHLADEDQSQCPIEWWMRRVLRHFHPASTNFLHCQRPMLPRKTFKMKKKTA